MRLLLGLSEIGNVEVVRYFVVRCIPARVMVGEERKNRQTRPLCREKKTNGWLRDVPKFKASGTGFNRLDRLGG